MLSGVFFFRPKAYSPAYIGSLTEVYRGCLLTMNAFDTRIKTKLPTSQRTRKTAECFQEYTLTSYIFVVVCFPYLNPTSKKCT